VRGREAGSPVRAVPAFLSNLAALQIERGILKGELEEKKNRKHFLLHQMLISQTLYWD
jgi:hypothetical protein